MAENDDRHDGICHLLGSLASFFRSNDLPLIAAAIEGNIEGIAIDISVKAESTPVLASILDTTILMARGELNAD